MIEGAAIVVVAALLAALLLVMGGESRRQARLGEDIAKLRQFGAATGSYAADNADLFWSFSWKKGQSLSQYPDLNNAASDLQAGANQAVDILRRRAGREDIQPIPLWIPHWQFSYLALADHMLTPLPDLGAVSAADERRTTWARNPKGFDAGLYPPGPTSTSAPGTNNGKRWPYSASFHTPTAFYDGSITPYRVSQAGVHNLFSVPAEAQLGGRPVSECAFPSHKTHLHDSSARHFGTRVAYCTHDQARLSLLFVDGAVSVRAAKDSNPGWQPNSPAPGPPTQFNYQPDAWEPPTLSGTPAEPVIGRFRWTRGCPANMLAGRDFGGPEVCPPLP